MLLLKINQKNKKKIIKLYNNIKMISKIMILNINQILDYYQDFLLINIYILYINIFIINILLIKF